MQPASHSVWVFLNLQYLNKIMHTKYQIIFIVYSKSRSIDSNAATLTKPQRGGEGSFPSAPIAESAAVYNLLNKIFIFVQSI